MTAVTLLSQTSDPLALVGNLGASFGVSGMFGCKTKEQGHVLALHCVMENVSPLTILQTYHFIEGKLSMRADAMLGRANAAGFRHKILSRTADLAKIYIADDEGDGNEFSLSWEDCQKEPFVKDKNGSIKTNYATPRARTQMLWARVVSEAVRATCPHVVCGAYTPEELDDLSDSVTVESQNEQATAPNTATAAPATERKSRKKSEAQTQAPETSAAAAVASNESLAGATTGASETVTVATGEPASATNPNAESKSESSAAIEATEVAKEASNTIATAPVLPQKVADIIALRDYVGPRWPADHKNGAWPQLWSIVKQRLNIPAGETDEEQFCKAPEPARDKAYGWLNQQKGIVDKMSTSKDVSTWANQNPTTTAAKA